VLGHRGFSIAVFRIARVAGIDRISGIDRIAGIPGIPGRPPGIPVGIAPPSSPIGVVKIVGAIIPERSPPEVEPAPKGRTVVGCVGCGIIIVIDVFYFRGNHDPWFSVPGIDGDTTSDEGNQRKQNQQFFHLLTPYFTGTHLYCKFYANVSPLKDPYQFACSCPQIIPPVLNLYNNCPCQDSLEQSPAAVIE
jgi:hypothetical protein